MSLDTAHYAGTNLERTTLVTIALSGGLAALAGVCEVAGVQGQLKHGLSPGYGYTAIIVAWVGRLNPWGIVAVSEMLQIAMNLPIAVAYMLQGLILFSVLALECLDSHRLVWRHSR